jgi:hypothetical protein
MRCEEAMNEILRIKFGSHLYGTSTPTSDLDLKAIYLPSAREIVLGSYKKTISKSRPKAEAERNNKDDIDLEIFSLDRYLELLMEGQTVALDILFSTDDMVINKSYSGLYPNPFDVIYWNRHRLLTRNVCSFIGYAKQQAAKYGLKGFRVHALRITLEWLMTLPEHSRLDEWDVLNFIKNCENEHIKHTECKGPSNKLESHLEVCNKKYPFRADIKYIKSQIQRRFDEYGKRALMAEKNEGLDFKSLSHAVRVNNEAVELLETGSITFPRPDKDLLLKIKLGEIPYKEVANMIENGLELLKIAQINSKLRDEPDKEWADNFIYEVYSRIVKNEN